MKLVIVESPAKSKTIGHYLGSDYDVEASVGHVRDLAIQGKEGLGIDISNDFKPTYVVNKDKTAVVKSLKAKAKKADEILLATDPDREGEAIAWHLAEVLSLPIEKTKRLEFHEITKKSILNAIDHSRTIDMNLVHSQEARRIIDRILGFRLSKLLQSKIKSQSAGRVQSATLGIICDHEKEILNFISEEYWTINSPITKDEKEIKLELLKDENGKVELKNKEQADKFISKLNKKLVVNDIKKTTKSIASKDPFRTSTLEQSAYSNLGFKTKTTASVAQSLYEGVETNEGLVGLITYMRTDSTRISDAFVAEAKEYIINTYGDVFYKGTKVNKNVKLQQDAHECIRPTSIYRTPKSIKQYLNDRQYKLYKLIYDRTIASLMSDKVNEITTVSFLDNNVEFVAKGSVNVFPGYNIIKIDKENEGDLPIFNVGEEYEFFTLEAVQNFTKPPLRYNEGKLVKIMEEDGIGRPSTYASTIQTLITRKYITSDKEGLTPTEQGMLTSNVLKKYFSDLMNVEYTANMESELDKVQEGSVNEIELIRKFYDSFNKTYLDAKEKIYKEPLKTTGEKCPVCGGDLVFRKGRYGEFISCINYPKCKYVKKEEKEAPKEVGRNCPSCGSPLVYRKNKKGDEFIACSAYPSCKYIESIEDPILKDAPTKVCPSCGGTLTLRKYRKSYFYGCSNYPKCKHSEPYEKK